MMKRSDFYAASTLLVSLTLAPALPAATTIASTQVLTNPGGASFYVDGQLFTSSATFLWPAGSKHTLNIQAVQQDSITRTSYNFTGWTDSTGLLSMSTTQIVITADPSITFYQAAVTVQYAVSLSFFRCSNPDPTTCHSPGAVYVNNTPYLVNSDVYLNAGSTVVLRAAPNPGFVFTGWLDPMGHPLEAFLTSFTLNSPVFVDPQFLPAARITIVSSPPGLQVLADRTPAYSPITLDWGLGTTHTLGAVTPQTDHYSRLWVFDSWSDQGAETHSYTVPEQVLPVTLTAKYVPGIAVSFLTAPLGLELTVDGVSNLPLYNFAWAAGVAHTVSAPQQQTDQSGRGWVFRSWSNGGPATQTITLTSANAAGFRLIANYDPLSQTVIQSSPSGMHLQADGADCITPCTLQRPIGSTIQVSAPPSIQVSADTRLLFTGWSDGSSGDHAITAAPGPQVVIANYQSDYRLGYSSNVPDAVTWHFSPAPVDNFYAAQTEVTVSPVIAPGYRFHRWEGDASGTSEVITVTMSGPLNIRARVDKVDYVGIDAVVNAAGSTPENAVAPGSIVSVYGDNLAPSVQAGPASPLAQTLAGVTVSVGDRFLPLLFVSPGQINVELPSDLASGMQTLKVRQTGLPDAAADFTVQRNAPGLFYQELTGQAFAIMLHADGSLVSPASPARRGELVTLLGTGFGPYQPQPPDGFAVPGTVLYPLKDTVELVCGDKTITPEFAGAAQGRVGVAAVKFRIADPLPQASTIEIKARVNGHESNTVLVPLN